MDWKIPLFKIYWDETDIKMVTEVIQRGMYWAIGPNIEKLERMLADYIGTKYAVAFSSGTSALHAALFACGIGAGDEVIVPSFTFIATANAPLFVGAKPVFADIEEKTGGLDPRDVDRRITPRTRAILPIHYSGSPCFINELKQVAQKHNLLLIEDAAESLGATIDGKKAGSFGTCAILSFCANKVITTGEGGAVVTDSTEIYEKLRLKRSHGRASAGNCFSSTGYDDYVTLGYNYRISDITAALGIAQLGKIDQIIKMRGMKAGRLSAGLAGIDEIEIPHCPPECSHVYQMYVIKVKAGQEKRNALAAHLASKGIMTKVNFLPVHLTRFYRHELGYNEHLSVTEKVAGEVLTLPMYPSLTEDEISYIAAEVAAFFRQGNK